jgi:hypothetical protein
MEQPVVIKQGHGSLMLVGVVGAVVGFIAGHALGAQLTEGTLKAAIEAAGSQILRSTNGPVVLAMGIQAATAIICAAIVPAVTALVLHRQLQHEENTHERELCSHQKPGALPRANRDRHGDRRRDAPPRHAASGRAVARRAGDGVRAGLEDRHNEER